MNQLTMNVDKVDCNFKKILQNIDQNTDQQLQWLRLGSFQNIRCTTVQCQALEWHRKIADKGLLWKRKIAKIR